jgi:DNA-binding response OmpR family regulator
VLEVGPLVLDRVRREVRVDGRLATLTFSEFELLQTLMSRPGHLFDRQALLSAIYGDTAYRDPRGIDVHVRHLRVKLEQDPEWPKLILTVRGVGYRLNG